eukprot:5267178-Prorocentrum_lima.AAC.1
MSSSSSGVDRAGGCSVGNGCLGSLLPRSLDLERSLSNRPLVQQRQQDSPSWSFGTFMLPAVL